METVAIQGGPGSFHELASKKILEQAANLVYCGTFDEVFKALKDRSAGLAICATRNSAHGPIQEVQDLFKEFNVKILQEVDLRIHQNLIALPASKTSDITDIFSHPVAFSQCLKYLESNFPNATKHHYDDTAGAVEYVKQTGQKNLAAIASQQAAELYDMRILEKGIEDNSENYTSFAVVQLT